jgi:hypothetical protein
MKIIYTENNTKIIDSYKYNASWLVNVIVKERLEKSLPITRSMISYASEIKAHNRLYKLGLFRSHTKDCDCEENIKKWKDILFKIIGW